MDKCKVDTYRGSDRLGIGVYTPCGKKTMKGKPYCSYHSPKATKRREERLAELREITNRRRRRGGEVRRQSR